MTRTITRLFNSHTEALAAVDELENEGVDRDAISLVSNNADNWHSGQPHPERRATDRPLGDGDDDDDHDVAEGAGKGAATGGLIGGGAGLLAGLGMLAIPGLGPVVAAGWLVSTAIGAAAGGATGGLLGALKDAGHSDEEANVYTEGVRRGGTLVSVKADEIQVNRIEQILSGQFGVDARSRGEVYRQSGWSRFDDTAPPYSAEDISRERQLYRR